LRLRSAADGLERTFVAELPTDLIEALQVLVLFTWQQHNATQAVTQRPETG
jgi:hypothetical protein